MKRQILLLLAVGLLLAGAFQAADARAGRGLTMLVVPARYSAIQLGMDLVARYPAVLVSYQGDAASQQPILHAWNGEEWVKVPMEDYASAAFLQTVPARAILVGDEKLLPEVLSSSVASWCGDVTVLRSLDTASLVNELSRLFNFKSGEWRWFARRYNLTLEDGNAAARQESWYDRSSYEDEWTPKLKRRSSDAVAEPPAAVAEPAPVPVGEIEEPAPAPEAAPLPAGAEAIEEQAPQFQKEPRVLVPSVTEPAMPPEGEEPIIQSPGGVVTDRTPSEPEPAPVGWEERAVAVEPPVK